MKTPLPKLAFVFLLLLPLLGRAQQTRITGRVVDAKTKDPVPFATISLREEECKILTNEFGYFQLSYVQKSNVDSIIVQTVGYGRYAMLLKQGNTENIQIELKRCPCTSAEIQFFATSKIKRAKLLADDINSAKQGRITGELNTEYAFLIKSEAEQATGNIRSVSLDLHVVIFQ